MMQSAFTPVTTVLRRPVHHVGFAVADLESAISTWTSVFGAGPFFKLPNISFDEATRDGQPATWEHTAAFARCGTVRMELQEHHKLQPGLDGLLMCNGPNTINHVAVTVEDPAAESARLQQLGFALGLYTRFGELEFFTHDAGGVFGFAIEIMTAGPAVDSMWERIDAETSGWDGSDPVRQF